MSKTKIPSQKRVQILNRDGNRCLWCGRGPVEGVKLHIDHIVSEHFGGSSDFDNLGTLCDLCNLGKSQEYYGNYLLSTIFKVPDIWNRLKTYQKEEPIIGKRYYLVLDFYESNGESYSPNKIYHDYFIEDLLLLSKSDSSEIKINEIKEKALLELKDKVKEFLFENHGFFTLSGEKIVFKKFKKD